MDEAPEDKGAEAAGWPRDLRFLKTLVTVLTAVMIAGVITIVALLVIRLNAETRAVLVHPEVYALPAGVGTLGYSLHDGRAILVGDDGVIRVFDAASGALLQDFVLGE